MIADFRAQPRLAGVVFSVICRALHGRCIVVFPQAVPAGANQHHVAHVGVINALRLESSSVIRHGDGVALVQPVGTFQRCNVDQDAGG